MPEELNKPLPVPKPEVAPPPNAFANPDYAWAGYPPKPN